MPSTHPSTTDPLPDHALDIEVRGARHRAERAAAAHALRRAHAVALLVRSVFPAASAIVADLAGWFSEELIPTLVEIHDADGAVLWCDDGASVPCLPTGDPDPRWTERRQAVEEHLSVALEFATPSLAGWHDLDPDRDLALYAIPLPDHRDIQSAVATGVFAVGWHVWVLHHVDTDGDDISLHASHQAAQSALAQTVRQRWHTITDQHGIPATSDRLTNEQAIDLYFARSPSWSHYSLYLDDVDGDLVPVEVF